MKKIYKKFVGVLIILSVMSMMLVSVMAQDTQEYGVGETAILIDPALKLDISHTRQDYPNQKFTVILQINSQINSGKVGVEWTYPTNLLQIEGPQRDIVSVSVGNTTTVEKVFFPVESAIEEDVVDYFRTVEVGIRVNAFTAERNYLSTTSFEIKFNKLMEILPIDDEYKKIKTFKIALDWGKKMLLVLTILGIIIFAIKKFVDYINSPDKVV